MNKPFSVLMAVYRKDDPEQFRKAYLSVTKEQTLKPNEVIIVQDGPVPAALKKVITECASNVIPTKILVLAYNKGLAYALQEGLKKCSYENVARMDADDISVPERFSLQSPLLEKYDLVGGALQEFKGTNFLQVRMPPLTSEKILEAAKWRSPFNHPTVMYRRSIVEAAGGYEDLPLLEDYWLFVRMLQNKAKVANVPAILVHYRVDYSYTRRGGKEIFYSELKLQRYFRSSKFISRKEYLRNILIRGGYRLIPEKIRTALYRKTFTQ